MIIEKINSLLNKNNFDFHYLDEVKSTMLEIKKIKSKRNICLMANEQIEGIGRRGAKWISPKGNVYVSILLRNVIDIKNHFYNTAFITNTICDVIEKTCKVNARIKWPNDILINDKKICGIISEIQDEDNNVLINTGFGINIISAPIVKEYHTTNINNYNKNFDNFNFVYEIMNEYFKNFETLKNLSSSIIEKYKFRLRFIGQNIKLKLDNNLIKEGVFTSLNEDGSIKLNSNLGVENIYNARIIK